jgi:hypothetical protein
MASVYMSRSESSWRDKSDVSWLPGYLRVEADAVESQSSPYDALPDEGISSGDKAEGLDVCRAV